MDLAAFLTDCPVLTDSIFRVLFAYFDESMASIRGVLTIEKLEYSRFYNQYK